MLNWLKKIGIFLVGLAGFIGALILMGGGKRRVDKADAKMEEARKLRERADLIDQRIEELKAKNKLTDAEIAAERKRIEGLQTLEEIEDAFTELGY
jgi:hypothetical protein